MILILYRDLFFLLALININSVIYNKWFIFFLLYNGNYYETDKH